jgi:Spy/CpxP family protein refolding chaperone
MKKLLLAILLIACPTAFAADMDFAAFNDAHHPGMRKMHRCLKKSWKAANPTDQQGDTAKRYMDEAKAVMDQHKDAIHSAMEAMKTAWSKHPIVQAEVVAAEDSLREHGMPVRVAFRDAGINTLNLLSSEQRTAFDNTFKDCID